MKNKVKVTKNITLCSENYGYSLMKTLAKNGASEAELHIVFDVLKRFFWQQCENENENELDIHTEELYLEKINELNDELKECKNTIHDLEVFYGNLNVQKNEAVRKIKKLESLLDKDAVYKMENEMRKYKNECNNKVNELMLDNDILAQQNKKLFEFINEYLIKGGDKEEALKKYEEFANYENSSIYASNKIKK